MRLLFSLALYLCYNFDEFSWAANKVGFLAIYNIPEAPVKI